MELKRLLSSSSAVREKLVFRVILFPEKAKRKRLGILFCENKYELDKKKKRKEKTSYVIAKNIQNEIMEKNAKKKENKFPYTSTRLRNPASPSYPASPALQNELIILRVYMRFDKNLI